MPRKLKPCDGTSADYMRHRDRGEPPCKESKRSTSRRRRLIFASLRLERICRANVSSITSTCWVWASGIRKAVSVPGTLPILALCFMK